MLSSPEPLFDILHEDEDLLVIDKPAGLVCHPTKGDSFSSLIGRIRLHLGLGKEAHMINRLDRETSGIVLVAKNLEKARYVRRHFEGRTVRKHYLGIAHGWMRSDFQVIEAPLGKDIHSLVAIKNCVRSDGSPSRTELAVLKRVVLQDRPYSLLHLSPLTGRKHQIRIHLSHAGHPLVGDKLYGANERLYLAFVEGRLTESDWRELVIPFHALHCSRIAWRLESGAEVNFQSPIPARFAWFQSGNEPVIDTQFLENRHRQEAPGVPRKQSNDRLGEGGVIENRRELLEPLICNEERAFKKK